MQQQCEESAQNEKNGNEENYGVHEPLVPSNQEIWQQPRNTPENVIPVYNIQTALNQLSTDNQVPAHT